MAALVSRWAPKKLSNNTLFNDTNHNNCFHVINYAGKSNDYSPMLGAKKRRSQSLSNVYHFVITHRALSAEVVQYICYKSDRLVGHIKRRLTHRPATDLCELLKSLKAQN